MQFLLVKKLDRQQTQYILQLQLSLAVFQIIFYFKTNTWTILERNGLVHGFSELFLKMPIEKIKGKYIVPYAAVKMIAC